MSGALIRTSKQTAHRHERQRPGEIVHMDVKKLGTIPDGGGWRTHGRANAPKSRAGAGTTSRATTPALQHLHPGWRTTPLNEGTARSEACPRSVDRHLRADGYT
ncbi:hypothetical protein GCM10009595_00330 [Falsarthrobacter nasiphocae]